MPLDSGQTVEAFEAYDKIYMFTKNPYRIYAVVGNRFVIQHELPLDATHFALVMGKIVYRDSSNRLWKATGNPDNCTIELYKLLGSVQNSKTFKKLHLLLGKVPSGIYSATFDMTEPTTPGQVTATWSGSLATFDFTDQTGNHLSGTLILNTTDPEVSIERLTVEYELLETAIVGDIAPTYMYNNLILRSRVGSLEARESD